MPVVVVDRRLYLTADRSRIVEEGDPRAHSLYATPGMTITVEEAKRYGLIDKNVPESVPIRKATTPQPTLTNPKEGWTEEGGESKKGESTRSGSDASHSPKATSSSPPPSSPSPKKEE